MIGSKLRRFYKGGKKKKSNEESTDKAAGGGVATITTIMEAHSPSSNKGSIKGIDTMGASESAQLFSIDDGVELKHDDDSDNDDHVDTNIETVQNGTKDNRYNELNGDRSLCKADKYDMATVNSDDGGGSHDFSELIQALPSPQQRRSRTATAPLPPASHETFSASAEEIDYGYGSAGGSMELYDDDYDDDDDHDDNNDDEGGVDEYDEDFDTNGFDYSMRTGRTLSTTMRLQEEGLTDTSNTSGLDYAVQSIARGSESWAALIKPFVSDLAFRSLLRRRYKSPLTFRLYTCRAAVLFVDLSGYSKITAAIAHRGAHFLSNVVNAYLEKLIAILYQWGGDCVKFAGDAVLVIFEGDELDWEYKVLCAAHCGMEIQRQAATHPVEGTDLSFSNHCGLTFGTVQSEIFAAPTNLNMQRLYHSVGGEAINSIGDLVDFAQAGEVCVDPTVMEVIGDRGSYRPIVGEPHNPAKILTDLRLDDDTLDRMEQYVEKSIADRLTKRSNMVEEDFIHPSVLKLLSHGGLSPTQIAQMRNLCVLFIAMTSSGSSVNWLMEVQGVLDKNRCPIVQIIDDDKGVHVVAAVNLYETVPEANILGIDICQELVKQEVGCAVGMAAGSTFCGVTGSNLACRWDITGAPVVRAARLMQYALSHHLKVAIDESIFLDQMAATRLRVASSDVTLKGAPDKISVYTLSETNRNSAFRVLETVHGRCHDDAVFTVTDWITRPDHQRCAVLVKGPPFAGKKIVCQRAAGYAETVPFLHVCDKSFGLLQLARTIALWFQYAPYENVMKEAELVMDLMDQKKFSRAHDACISLVDTAIGSGMNSCFLVDRIQFLDDFSLSLIKDCLSRDDTPKPGSLPSSPRATGTLCFLCCHVTLYNHLSADHIISDITGEDKSKKVLTIEVVEAGIDELRTMFHDISDMDVEDRWLRTYAESSGNSAGYFMQRADAVRLLTAKLWSEGKQGYTITTEELVLSIPSGYLRKTRELTVMEISTSLATRFAQLYDDLPPLFQLFSKVLHIATRRGYFKLPRKIMWEALNDLVAKGVEGGEMAIVLEEMKEMYLVAIEEENGNDVLSFRNPALGDIAIDVCTPVQIETIGKVLLERIGSMSSSSFKVPLVLADLNSLLNRTELLKSLWHQAYQGLMEESKDWPAAEVNLWKEIIDDEIRGSGFRSTDILGDTFSYPISSNRSAGTELSLLKLYVAPVAFGPMGHSLSAICRNVFHEFGIFHGMSENAMMRLVESTQSATERYLKEMEVVDAFLTDQGFETPLNHIESERAAIEFLASPPSSDGDVLAKANQILGVYIPYFVEARLQKLRDLTAKLRNGPTPDVVKYSPAALRKAYEVIKSSTCRNEAAQKAILMMASMNWRPRDIPEYLPSRYYQTLARIRTTILRRLDESELAVLFHQQTTTDLEAFLLTTPLLYSSPEVNALLFSSS